MEMEKYLKSYVNPVEPEIGRRYRIAVIICPGGGYSTLIEREADMVALRYQAYGCQAFILRYPLQEQFPQAMYVLAEAVAYIRSRVEEWDIDPEHIFGCGFSAGGHLVASLGCYGGEELKEKLGLKEKCTLNGLILGYPVITGESWGHQESIDNLIRDNYRLKEWISLEKQIQSDMPPVFVWHCYDDVEVDVDNTLVFVRALRAKNVSCECHIFPAGGHGLSLCDECSAEIESQIRPNVGQWFVLSLNWMRQQCRRIQCTMPTVSDKKREQCIEEIKRSEHISDEIIGFIKSSHKKYIYGNGLQAGECLRIFREMGVPIEGILLPPGGQKSSLSGYWGELLARTPAYGLDIISEEKEKIDVLLAIERTSYVGAEKMLKTFGFHNLYTCCWDRNLYMKQICYTLYKEL